MTFLTSLGILCKRACESGYEVVVTLEDVHELGECECLGSGPLGWPGDSLLLWLLFFCWLLLLGSFSIAAYLRLSALMISLLKLVLLRRATTYLSAAPLTALGVFSLPAGEAMRENASWRRTGAAPAACVGPGFGRGRSLGDVMVSTASEEWPEESSRGRFVPARTPEAGRAG
jgi:hypothetical protein